MDCHGLTHTDVRSVLWKATKMDSKYLNEMSNAADVVNDGRDYHWSILLSFLDAANVG